MLSNIVVVAELMYEAIYTYLILLRIRIKIAIKI